MINGLLISLLLLAVLLLIIGVILLLRSPNHAKKGHYTVEELGRLEGSFNNLRQVIIMCHRIEDPKDHLRDAVRKNFSRQVKYLFLVSNSRAQQESTLGYQIFRVLADIVIRENRKAMSVEDLVEIRGLPFDWIDTPYVFYQTQVEDRPGTGRVIAVRGNQMKEGIAASYSMVDPRSARTILQAILAGAPEKIVMSADLDQFEYGEDSKITSMEDYIRRTGGIRGY